MEKKSLQISQTLILMITTIQQFLDQVFILFLTLITDTIQESILTIGMTKMRSQQIVIQSFKRNGKESESLLIYQSQMKVLYI